MDQQNIHLATINPHHAHITLQRKVYDKLGQREAEIWHRKEDSKFVRELIQAGYDVIYTPDILSNYHPQRSAERLPHP